jgi:hypothetical protein
MCTVTYIPRGNSSFVLTHNRDESVKRRIASPPVSRMINGMSHLYPVDPEGKGTWVGISETGRVASLLNGGDQKHSHNPPYRHSRGLIIPEYFTYPSFIEFYYNFDFVGLEPFTLLVFEDGHIFETILNENGVKYRSLNPEKPFIYLSTPLYSRRSRDRKQDRFLEWYLANPAKGENDILEFHRENMFENETDKSQIPAGHILKTVSITSISHIPNDTEMFYLDLLNDINFRHSLQGRKKIFEGV